VSNHHAQADATALRLAEEAPQPDAGGLQAHLQVAQARASALLQLESGKDPLELLQTLLGADMSWEKTLQTALDSAEARADATGDKLAQAEAELAMVRETLRIEQATVTSLRLDLSQAEGDKRALREELSAEQTARRDLEAKEAAANAELASARWRLQEMDALRRSLEESSARCAVLEDRLARGRDLLEQEETGLHSLALTEKALATARATQEAHRPEAANSPIPQVTTVENLLKTQLASEERLRREAEVRETVSRAEADKARATERALITQLSTLSEELARAQADRQAQSHVKATLQAALETALASESAAKHELSMLQWQGRVSREGATEALTEALTRVEEGRGREADLQARLERLQGGGSAPPPEGAGSPRGSDRVRDSVPAESSPGVVHYARPPAVDVAAGWGGRPAPGGQTPPPPGVRGAEHVIKLWEGPMVVLRSGTADTDAVLSALLTMGKLAGWSQGRRVLGESGACEALLGVLRRYPEDAGVQLAALEGLRLLARSEENSRALGAGGACDLLAEAMEAFPLQRDVQHQGCMAAVTLALVEENTRRLGEAEVCALVALAMRQFEDDADIQLFGSWAFKGLAAVPENAARLREVSARQLVGTAKGKLFAEQGVPDDFELDW
jgi:hypothetical protein